MGRLVTLRVLEEEAQQVTALLNELRCLSILLVDAEFSQLLDAYHQLVQLLQGFDGVCDILFCLIQKSDLLASSFNYPLALSSVCFYALYLVDHDYRLRVYLVQLVPGLLLGIGLFSDTFFDL